MQNLSREVVMENRETIGEVMVKTLNLFFAESVGNLSNYLSRMVLSTYSHENYK